MNYTLQSALRYLFKTDFGLFFLKEYIYTKLSRKFISEPAQLIHHVNRSIELALEEKSKLLTIDGYPILSVPGMSSTKVRHLLNNLCSIKNINHLEIGSWKGSTLLSTKFKNDISSIAIDNWSQFNGPKKEFHDNIQKYGMNDETQSFDCDSFKFDLNNLSESKINFYFYDGDHSYDSHKQAFIYYNSILADLFLAVVDDYNSESVQQGTQDAFKILGYNVIFERYLSSSGNQDVTSWWNGIYIAVIDKRNCRLKTDV